MLKFIALFFILLVTSSHAGGRGGHNTTWDANLFPGATITTINCNGATDSTALASFVTAGVAAGSTPQVLRLVGPVCNFESNSGLVWDGNLTHSAVANATIWAYGTRVNVAYIGGTSIIQDKVHSSRIQTVSAASSTVTLVTGSEISRFSVGSWICVTGQSIQAGASFPPNFQLFEYRLITAINGSIVTLDTPLTYSYKSTWPLADPSGAETIDQGGPGTIYLMAPSWNIRTQVFGLTVANSATQLTLTGRVVGVYDVVFGGTGFSPTASQYAFVGSSVFGQTEVDKLIGTFSVNRSRFYDLDMFNASVDTSVFTNVTSSVSIGSAKNTSLVGGSSPIVVAGPNGFGHGVSLTADGVAITTARSNLLYVDKTQLSYSTGTFSVANASGQNFYDAMRWGVPGTKYYFGYFDGATLCNAGTTFTITDATQDGTNTNFVTDLVGALPTPSCNGNTYNKFVQYSAATITQKFSGPGDLTQFAAPP